MSKVPSGCRRPTPTRAAPVAYEGIDLQRRTCSIHHVDFPWTPADLEQRNGRGYRQAVEQGRDAAEGCELTSRSGSLTTLIPIVGR